MDGPRDEMMVDDQNDDGQTRLPLSSDEQRVLDLYDTLQRLRLEIAIITASASYSPGKVLNTRASSDDAPRTLPLKPSQRESRSRMKSQHRLKKTLSTRGRDSSYDKMQ